jgi:hypothetical protein
MMRVFKVESDFAFQSFFPYDPDDPDDSTADGIEDADISAGTGTPMQSSWKPLPLFADKPRKKRGAFAHLWGLSGYAVDARAREVFQAILGSTCEFLPFLPFDGETLYRMNVLERVDCLDQQKTKWKIGKKNGTRFGIEEYHFVPDRFTRSTLFRLPRGSALMAVVDLADLQHEFKTICEHEGMTGLKFEEIWAEGGSPIRTKSLLENALG